MRVQRTFAFIDLSGFTSLTDVHGDEPAVSVLASFRATVREVCSRRGVRIAKWLGDGAMLVSVETAPVIAAVLEMERRLADMASPLALRGGVTKGDVILFEGDDYIGTAVNLAARLCDIAAPHEVLATAEMAAAVPPWAIVEPVGERSIRGLGRPVPLVELGSRSTKGRATDGSTVDPVCLLELSSEAVVAERVDADGATFGFCSESCAQTWDGRRRPAPDPAWSATQVAMS